MTSKEDKIDEVRRQEERRGKRPIDIAERRRHLKLLQSFTILMENCANEREFSDRITADLGIVYGTPKYAEALKAYRAFRAAK
jgi:hypothetical protein